MVHAEVQAVLQLCCTSKALRAAVLQHCKGLLNVNYELRSHLHAQHFAAWLLQCGQLVGRLCCWPPDAALERRFADVRTEAEALSNLESAEQAIASALIQLHQKEQDGLQLHTLAWHRIGSSSAAAELLEVLPSDKLLGMGLWEEEAMEWEPASSADVSAGSIARFSKLQFLSIKAAVTVEQLQHTLPALTALTGLYFITANSSRCSKEQFAMLQQHLPIQLRGLSLEVNHGMHVSSPPLQLSHLSLLTTLNTLWVEEGSQLPQQLLQLHCSSGRSVQPLLGCPQLQHIDLNCCRAGADELRQLSRLTRLTHLSLSYAEHMYRGAADEAAVAWPQLAGALRALEIKGMDPGGLAVRTLKQLQHLHGLTRLSMQVTDDHEGDATALLVTPVECAEVLAGLTALRTLELSMDPGRHLLLHEQLAAANAYAAAAVAAVAAQGGAEAAPAGVGDLDAQALAPAAAAAAGAHAGIPAHWLANLLVEPEDMGQVLLPGFDEGGLVAGFEAAVAAEQAALPAAYPAFGAAALAAQPAWAHQHGAPPAGQHNPQPQAEQAVQQWFGWQAFQPQLPHFHHSPSPNMLPVTRAIAQLPHLDSLELKGSGLSLEAVELLTALTRLTRLTMSGCDFDEAAFASLALSLTGLRRLSIGGSERVGDAGLVVAARVLRHLTQLNLRSCSKVTDRGVLQLRSLQHLKLLLVEGSAVSQQAVASVLRNAPDGAQ
ncbi:hypothetical protein COO60DRAFT_741650 [Scenedesmus sp. NREL 46B-D3]|nr:hypothetical protein COO60DRAFT_741650 [Scenedesmus sp. NREL 46B-D3]